jgi:hypothetical protein
MRKSPTTAIKAKNPNANYRFKLTLKSLYAFVRIALLHQFMILSGLGSRVSHNIIDINYGFGVRPYFTYRLKSYLYIIAIKLIF